MVAVEIMSEHILCRLPCQMVEKGGGGAKGIHRESQAHQAMWVMEE